MNATERPVGQERNHVAWLGAGRDGVDYPFDRGETVGRRALARQIRTERVEIELLLEGKAASSERCQQHFVRGPEAWGIVVLM